MDILIRIIDYRGWYDGPLDGLIEVDGRIYCYQLHDSPRNGDQTFAYYYVAPKDYEKFFDGGCLYIEEANLEPIGFFLGNNADWSKAINFYPDELDDWIVSSEN